MSGPVEVVDAAGEVVRVSGVEPPEAMLWRHFRKVGVSLAHSGFVPQPYQGKPDEIMACLAYGHELGLGPMQSLQSIDVIQGKPTLKPETMRALIRAQGHSLTRIEASNTKVTLRGKRADTGDEETVTYTIEDARALGLTGKDNWKKQPRAMLTARATSEIGRSLFSDVIMGASYTPEELDTDTLVQVENTADRGGGTSGTTAPVDVTPSAEEALADPDVPTAPETLTEHDALVEEAVHATNQLSADEWRDFKRSSGIAASPAMWSDAHCHQVIAFANRAEPLLGGPEDVGARDAAEYTDAL